MKRIACRLPWLFNGVVLLAAVTLLAAARLEYCGQPEALRPRHNMAADTRGPTLAPPQKVVFVQIEADKPDLEVGWAER